MMGAQENRLDKISEEWKLNTADLLEKTDTKIFKLLTNPLYNFPTVLPDGSYKH